MKKIASFVLIACAAFPFGRAWPAERVVPFGTEPWGPEVFRDRRAKLLSQMKTGAAVVLSAPTTDNALDGSVRQEADFLYLTGLPQEAGAALLLAPQAADKEILYLAPSVPENDRWFGYRAFLPNRELEGKLGFRRLRRMETLGITLSTYLHHWHELHFLGPLVGYQSEVPRVLDIYKKTAERIPGSQIKDDIDLLPRMRMVKEPRELEKLTRAADITVAGHLEAMRRVHPGMREGELKHILEDAFYKAGAKRTGYGSIVGAGPDGCVLHYFRDDRVIDSNDLVLIDAGAEFDYYVSDVTRTFPANGKFSPEQRKLYDVVLRAQKAALAKVRAGVKWEELREAANKVIIDAGYYDYYIHSLGHFVGLQVHDAGNFDDPIPENAVITVEPGIYIPERNIGIRIEDTIVVTKQGHHNLSGKLPREIEEIERWMAGR